ncbi:MAG: gamma-glutamylcyclotransferase [Bdellovibrionales bacterium]|nr:gamma-glutamylcyclotransferase [Bdellovibrionales bacterium]
MRQCLFGYGSFSQGQVHFGPFANLIVSEKPAFVKGEMYRLASGYPVLDLDHPGEVIEGRLLELEAVESFWAIMDTLLGVDAKTSPFVRTEVQAMTDNYSKMDAQVYCLNWNRKPKGLKKIPKGDWQKNMAMETPFVDQLETRHRDYLLKLSKSRGREIVPIQLDLYRELLSMELIVDKGRRLALTPLGKEASLFLQ